MVENLRCEWTKNASKNHEEKANPVESNGTRFRFESCSFELLGLFHAYSDCSVISLFYRVCWRDRTKCVQRPTQIKTEEQKIIYLTFLSQLMFWNFSVSDVETTNFVDAGTESP